MNATFLGEEGLTSPLYQTNYYPPAAPPQIVQMPELEGGNAPPNTHAELLFQLLHLYIFHSLRSTEWKRTIIYYNPDPDLPAAPAAPPQPEPVLPDVVIVQKPTK